MNRWRARKRLFSAALRWTRYIIGALFVWNVLRDLEVIALPPTWWSADFYAIALMLANIPVWFVLVAVTDHCKLKENGATPRQIIKEHLAFASIVGVIGIVLAIWSFTSDESVFDFPRDVIAVSTSGFATVRGEIVSVTPPARRRPLYRTAVTVRTDAGVQNVKVRIKEANALVIGSKVAFAYAPHTRWVFGMNLQDR